MLNEKEMQLIEDYLSGEVGEQNKKEFENRLQEEPELKAEFTLQKEIHERLAILHKQEMLGEWEQLITEHEQNQSTTQTSNKSSTHSIGFYALRIAAILLLFLGAYWFLPQNQSPEQLAIHYWNETASLAFSAAERGGQIEDPTPSNSEEAYTLYNTGNYQDSVEQLEKMALTEPLSEEVLLLQGACYIQLKKPQKAITIFNDIMSRPTAKTKDEVRWYLALSHLQKGNVNESKTLLQDIIKKQSWNHIKARELLNKLK